MKQITSKLVETNTTLQETFSVTLVPTATCDIPESTSKSVLNTNENTTIT